MHNDQTLRDARREAENSPTAWFAVLERARQAHDFERAAQARRELERLGVKVKYTPAQKGGADGR